MDRVDQGGPLVEVNELDAAVFVAGVEGAVCWIECQAEGGGRKEERVEEGARVVVPYEAGVVLGSGDRYVHAAAAVACYECCDCCTVVCKGP